LLLRFRATLIIIIILVITCERPRVHATPAANGSCGSQSTTEEYGTCRRMSAGKAVTMAAEAATLAAA
jgi:hypothetical protein